MTQQKAIEKIAEVLETVLKNLDEDKYSEQIKELQKVYAQVNCDAEHYHGESDVILD